MKHLFDLIPPLLFASNGIDSSMTFCIKQAPYDCYGCYSLPSMLWHIQLQSLGRTWPWQNSSEDFTASCMEAFGCDDGGEVRGSTDIFDCNSAAASLVRSIFTVYKRSPYSAFKAYQTRSLRDRKKKDKELGFCSTCLKMIHIKGYLLGAQPSRCCSFAHLSVGQMVISCSLAHGQAQPSYERPPWPTPKKTQDFIASKLLHLLLQPVKVPSQFWQQPRLWRSFCLLRWPATLIKKHKWSWRVFWGISSSWKLLPEPRQDQCHGCHRSLAQIDERK